MVSNTDKRDSFKELGFLTLSEKPTATVTVLADHPTSLEALAKSAANPDYKLMEFKSGKLEFFRNSIFWNETNRKELEEYGNEVRKYLGAVQSEN